ncbi:MAG: hypothetical protein JWN15_2395, partial [Firmicutes bacterium]|nr:hypothetical protein [Bacillota bacterium]
MMSGTIQKVGRITVAIGLMLFGIALLVDNFAGVQSYTNLAIRLWPLLLVGFGGEYLIRSIHNSRDGTAGARLRFDMGGALLLVLVVMLSVGLVTFRSWLANPGIAFGIGPATSRAHSRTISAAGVKELQLDVPVGSLRLEPNMQSGEIRIEATYTVRGLLATRGDAAQQLDRIKLNVTEGESLKIRAEIPDGLDAVSVGLVVYAPPELRVQADAGAGTVAVQGYKGDMQLTTRLGRIEVDAASGSLNAGSSSGLISVRNFTGPV